MTNIIVVAFRRPWWNQPELKLYPRAPQGVKVPAKYEAALPSDAEVLVEIEPRKEMRRPAKPKGKKTRKGQPDPIALSELEPDATLPSDFVAA